MAETSPHELVIASTSADSAPASSIPCVICKRQFSRYTCPRCNIPYCSLVCFRSETHGNCSESFYRKEVELDVKSAPSANAEEKRRMLDLLKRFEEDALDDSPLLGSDDEDDEAENLSARLQGMDIDTASYDELWSILTPAERENFLAALNDPNSELAQQLLASEDLACTEVEPWWAASPNSASEQHDEVSSVSNKRPRPGTRPNIMIVPEPLRKRAPDTVAISPLLLYNISAVCIAYVYAVRHFATSPLSSFAPSDPDRVAAKQAITRLVPFLADRKSTTTLTSLSGTVTDMWSRFPPSEVNSRLFSLLLKDTAVLLRPAAVTVVGDNQATTELDAHPSADALRVLSDLASLFSDPSASSSAGPAKAPMPAATKTKVSHIVHKLTFYAAYVLGTPAPMLRVLADEAAMRAKTMESEGASVGASGKVERAGTGKAQSKIEEL